MRASFAFKQSVTNAVRQLSPVPLLSETAPLVTMAGVFEHSLLHDPEEELRAQRAAPGPRSFTVVYTNDEAAVLRWVHSLHPAGDLRNLDVGFDAEWRPCFVSGQTPLLATLQFATPTSALVIQLNALSRAPAGHRASGALTRLLSGCRSLSGMGIHDDFSKVCAAVAGAVPPAAAHTLIDLKKLSLSRGVVTSGGLLGLTQHLTPPVRKWKSKALQLSNWSRYPLDEAQVRYAAMDAWASLHCYLQLRGLAASPAGQEGAHGQGQRQGAAHLQHTPPMVSMWDARAMAAAPPLRSIPSAGVALAPLAAASLVAPGGEHSASPRMSLHQFKASFVASFGVVGHSADASEGWVNAAQVGQYIPRPTWPHGYGTLRRLAEAAGLEASGDFDRGVLLIRCRA